MNLTVPLNIDIQINIHPSTTFYSINITKIPLLDYKFSFFLTYIQNFVLDNYYLLIN